MYQKSICSITSGFFFIFASANVFAEDADVILGELSGTRIYATHNNIAAISAGTTSCNAGNKVLAWQALPSNQHPVITLNMYRLLDGRMTQIGQSWLKHGFTALQENICNFGCQPNPGGDGLGVGCSDPYGAGINQGPRLGSRRLVNPTNGEYDGLKAAQELNEFQATTPIDHGLQVVMQDLAETDARYFIEGHYISPDDAKAGNGNNNVSHAEVRITQDTSGNISITDLNPGSPKTFREQPAIAAWPYASFTENDATPDDGKVMVAYKASRISRTVHRYEYAVYNMNSERGIRSFTIQVGDAPVSNIGFSAVSSHGEQWSNAPWQSVIADGKATWSTSTFEDDENANAIRWGTTYNFWFDAQSKPVTGSAELVKFKPGDGSNSFEVNVIVPKN